MRESHEIGLMSPQVTHVFVLSGHKFKDVDKISGKYEPGPWYGASLRTKKLVPQDISTLCGCRKYPYPPKECCWRFQGDGVSKPKWMNQNWNFQKVWKRGLFAKKTSVGGVWTFSGTIYRFCSFNIKLSK